ncbi:hypothetical protein [Komagataeibacter sp. FNDCR2]|uniref:hypothetical protein n=1 Tax=Komagataeibacter sp. FNDCR2 TaxID=2878682 RepID=UPI001E5BD7E9|nr:hypothetical protein [Komagataeibacter sp. FNDCR2]MCE2575276.1 hypothetical protein [Komagataeibacter sp. FNDCR2]
MPDVIPANFTIKSIAATGAVSTTGNRDFFVEINISTPGVAPINLSLGVQAQSYALVPSSAYLALKKFVRALQLGVDSLGEDLNNR